MIRNAGDPGASPAGFTPAELEALRESEARYRAIFEVASVGLSQSDPVTGQIVNVNRRMCEITGYSRGELLTKRFFEITHPDDREYDKTQFERVVQGELPSYTLEKRYIRKDGSPIWVNVNMTVIRDAGGTPLRSITSVEDISIRRRLAAEREITVSIVNVTTHAADLTSLSRQVIGLLRDHFECKAVAIRLRRGNEFPYYDTEGFPPEFIHSENRLCQFDERGQIVTDHQGNPQLDCLCGSILCGQFDPASSCYTSRGSYWTNNTSALIATRPPEEHSLRTRNRCVTAGYESVALVAIRRGTTTYGLIQLSDRHRNRFTPERIALLETVADHLAIGIAQCLGQSRLQLLSTALDSSANAIVITDQTGTIEWANPAFTVRSGYSLAEVSGRNPRDLIRSGQHDSAYFQAMWSAILAGKVWAGEITNRRKDGSLFIEDMTITPVKDEQGEIRHFIAVKQDITDRKAIEQHLLRTQRMETIGRLASGVAHDLNNVLTPILMATPLFREELKSPDLLGIVDTVESSVKRGAGIIRQLLTFGRGLEGTRVPLQLGTLVEETIAILDKTFPKNITITRHFTPSLPAFLGDSTQIHQVLMNLCVNARDAMPAGGQLAFVLTMSTVNSVALPDPNVTPGQYLVLEVRDTGIGISSTHLERIFDPFFTTKATGEGTGLGLSTALGIIRSHRGCILVNSRPGEGATFTIYLPVAENVPVAAPEPPKTLTSKGQGERILIVDDEENVRLLIRRILESKGYVIVEAGNGVEALMLLDSAKPPFDLVVSDMVMPQMDGFTLFRAARDKQFEIPFILTGGLLPSPETIRDARLSAESFVGKPFHPTQLLAAIQHALHPPR